MNKYRKRQKQLRWLGATMLGMILALFAVHLIPAVGIALAVMPFAIRRKADGEEGGDTGLLDKIERGIDSLDKEVKELKKNGADAVLADPTRWPKELKTAMEELTKLKGVANDQAANQVNFQRTLDRVQSLTRREARSAFGNPIERIQRDPQLRARFNAMIRLAVSKEGDLTAVAADILERGDLPELAKSVKTKALGEDSSPGSTLINQDLLTEVYDTLLTYGIWNTFAVRNLGTKTTILPVKTARPVALAIISEGTQVTDDATKAGTTVTATVIDVAVLLNVYIRLIEDAEVDIVADIMDDFAQALAYRLDWFCTQASGGSNTTDGAFTGIFGGGGTAATATTGNTTVEAMDEADFRRALLTVDAAVLQRQARWWMHPQVLVRALGIKDANGRAIFLTALEAPNAGAIGSMFGYPITLGAACPSANTAGSKVAAFGDPNGQVVGIRKGFGFDASDHFRWDYLQRSFRGYGRCATKIRAATAFGIVTTAAV
jgi:HK97 family phage major capsid protein